jgi:CRP/FNR family transcriptional regulator
MSIAIASPASAAEILGTAPFFADLDPAILRQIVDGSWTRRYPKGQVLVHEGDRCFEVKLLEAGRVRVSRFTIAGQETVLFIRNAPTVFGEVALFDDAPCSATLIADSDLDVRLFDVDRVRAVFARHPEAALMMLRNMARVVRVSNERLADQLALDAPGRLAKWLLAQGSETDAFTFDQSQESLALGLGTTRVTVNRALRRFERLGLIEVTGREVRILDRRGLLAIMTP